MTPRIILAVGYFFFALSITLFNYVLLSYLGSFLPEVYAGLVMAAGALVAVGCFIYLPRFVARHGAQKVVLLFAFAGMIMLFALMATPSTALRVTLAALLISIQPLLLYELDLLLEATFDAENTTARVRTLFMTGGNLGTFAAPFLMGTLLGPTGMYKHVFLAGAVALVAFIVLIVSRRLPAEEAMAPSHIRETCMAIARNRDLAGVTLAHLVMYLLSIWATFYTPVYLHTVIGIPWSTLGWMFSLMLLPYVLIEYPAGVIADTYLGDKELMFAGFLIAGSALGLMSTLSPASSIFFILCILMATRVGAALVESMTEGHFFRRVSNKDIASVSVFRGVWPLGSIIAPIVATAILSFGTYQLFFAIVGIIVMVVGTFATFCVKDFR